MQFPSIRFNNLKPTIHPYPKNIAWEKNAFQYDEQVAFITDPLWHGGAYYVQESSSMFLGFMLETIFERKLIPNSSLKVLDLCAAPGGKTTHILDKISDNSFLIANELIPKRNKILRENLIRWGRNNCIVTQHEPKDFGACTNYFDIIVIDAPCSGEGLFRKNPYARNEWSEDNVAMCALRQREILQHSIPLLKDNGILFYSTCTFQQCENEDQIEWLLQNGFELVTFDISTFPEIEMGAIPNTFRFTLEKVKGSGFFIACLQKKKNIYSEIKSFKLIQSRSAFSLEKTKFNDVESWINNADKYHYYLFKKRVVAFKISFENELFFLLQSGLNVISFGTEIGELKKSIFIPSHNLALSELISNKTQSIELDKETSLQYLRKNDIQLHTNSLKMGWMLVSYKHVHLGWIKVLQGRVNNYLPNSLRILHF